MQPNDGQTSLQSVYRDKHGTEKIVIHNDGSNLKTTIRGVEFSGFDFDAFEPIIQDQAEQRGLFVLNGRQLCSCSISCEIPVHVVHGSAHSTRILYMELELGNPKSNGALDYAKLHLSLNDGDRDFRADNQENFEDALCTLKSEMSTTGYLRICHSCVLSDYSPYGHGVFGDLACFRDNRREFLAASNKRKFLEIWNTHTEMVQETHVCPEFTTEKNSPE